MYQIDPEIISDFLNESFPGQCSTSLIADPHSRFKLKVDYDDFFMIISASEARICLYLFANEFEEGLRHVLLSQIVHIKQTIEQELSPYILSVWKNDSKMYQSLPDVDSLRSNADFFIEICTGPCDISSEADALNVIRALLKKSLGWIFAVSDETGEEEGDRYQYLSSRVERSRKNRDLCIALNGYECKVCDEKMTEKYGGIANNFIHVHHLESLAKGGKKWIDPAKDLITVCPNCHSMLHRKEPPLLPEELKKMLVNDRDK